MLRRSLLTHELAMYMTGRFAMMIEELHLLAAVVTRRSLSKEGRKLS